MIVVEMIPFDSLNGINFRTISDGRPFAELSYMRRSNYGLKI